MTKSDPALTDLRPLLLNKAITLGNLDRYEEGLTVAGQVRQLVGQASHDVPDGSGAHRRGPVALSDGALGRGAG
jgi:hypothetical protein